MNKKNTISQEINEFVDDIVAEKERKKKNSLINTVKSFFVKIVSLFKKTPLQKYKKQLKIQKKRKRERKIKQKIKKSIFDFITSFFSIFSIFSKKKKSKKIIPIVLKKKKTEVKLEKKIESIVEEEIKGKYKPYCPKEKIKYNNLSC